MTNSIPPAVNANPNPNINPGEAPVVPGRDNESVFASVSVEPPPSCEKVSPDSARSIRDNVEHGGQLPHIKEQAKISWKTGAVYAGAATFVVYLVARNFLLKRISNIALDVLFEDFNRHELKAAAMGENKAKAELMASIRGGKDLVAKLLSVVMNPLHIRSFRLLIPGQSLLR